MSNNNDKRARTALTVTLMMGATVVSKLLGMLRSVFMADSYGTSTAANAFTAAYRIPNNFFDILFSAAIVGCFIPVYNSFSEEKSEERGDFARIFLNFILLLTGALSIVGVIFARPIISLAAPGLGPEAAELAALLLRVLFPSIIFIGAAYTLVGVMQSKGRYLLPAAISSVSNFCVILYFIFLNDRLGERGIIGLGVAYLAAWGAQFLTLAIPLAISGVKYRPVLDFKNAAFLRAFKMLPTIMAGSWLIPVSNLAATYFASFADGTGGAVSVFDYSWNIYIIIAGTLVYSVCQYLFPLLSRRSAEGDSGGFGASVSSGLLALMALTLPFISGALVLSREGVALMYLRGEFTPSDAENVALTLRMLLSAVPAFAVNELFSRVYYSRGETKLPMLAALVGITVNIACSAVTVRVFDMGLYAVALSNALGQYASAVILLICAARMRVGIFTRSFFSDLIKIVASGTVSSAAMAIIYVAFINRLPLSFAYEIGFAANLAVCAAVFIPAAAIYFIILRLSKFSLLQKSPTP